MLTIFTFAFNKPEFIAWQYKTMKKFILDKFELIVFNDANNNDMYQSINNECKKFNLKCIDIPQDIHGPPNSERFSRHIWNTAGARNCDVVKYALENFGFSLSGILMIIDSDAFPIEPISIVNLVKNYDIAGIAQNRIAPDGTIIDYLWIGFSILNLDRMPNKYSINFDGGYIKGVNTDVGGCTYHYLNSTPKPKVNFLTSGYSCCYRDLMGRKKDGEKVNDDLLELFNYDLNSDVFVDRKIFHYKNGSEWDNIKRPDKMERVEKFINKIIQ